MADLQHRRMFGSWNADNIFHGARLFVLGAIAIAVLYIIIPALFVLIMYEIIGPASPRASNHVPFGRTGVISKCIINKESPAFSYDNGQKRMFEQMDSRHITATGRQIFGDAKQRFR